LALGAALAEEVDEAVARERVLLIHGGLVLGRAHDGFLSFCVPSVARPRAADRTLRRTRAGPGEPVTPRAKLTPPRGSRRAPRSGGGTTCCPPHRSQPACARSCRRPARRRGRAPPASATTRPRRASSPTIPGDRATRPAGSAALPP